MCLLMARCLRLCHTVTRRRPSGTARAAAAGAPGLTAAATRSRLVLREALLTFKFRLGRAPAGPPAAPGRLQVYCFQGGRGGTGRHHDCSGGFQVQVQEARTVLELPPAGAGRGQGHVTTNGQGASDRDSGRRVTGIVTVTVTASSPADRDDSSR